MHKAMNIKTLKSEIYQKLDELDEQGLNEVNEMVTAYLKNTELEDQWDTLSEEDKAAIEEGIQQIERGEFYTYEEVRQMIRTEFNL
jgi:predicted transcriptional regulator